MLQPHKDRQFDFLADSEQKLKTVIRDVPDFPKPGIIFKDITPILASHEHYNLALNSLTTLINLNGLNDQIDAIAGIESRGFLFGMMLAKQFNVPF